MGRETVVWLIGAAWLSVIAGGLWAWERYEVAPGASAPAVETDPAAPNRWQLTVFVHPHCPCSRATLAELVTLAGTSPDLATRVLFVLPRDTAPGWERGASWDAACRLSGADVALDPGGAEARRFGAATSGQAVLTDLSGRVVFRGGLTPGRGRAGASAGRAAVLDWLHGRPGASAAPVFGCALFAPDE